MNNGYCKLHRKLFDNEMWLLETFTKGQAWIDLFANANYKDGSFEVRGNIIPIKRGQIGWSELTMAKRWKWSRNKVRRYLKWLETIQQIEQQKDRYLTTIITIINYDKYQSDTADDTAERQQTIQQTIHKQRKDKKVKKEKNIKRVIEKVYQPPNLTDKDFEEVAEKYNTTMRFVQFQYDKMVTWAESRPNNPKLIGRNWKMTLMSFVRDDMLKIKQDYGKQNSEVSI